MNKLYCLVILFCGWKACNAQNFLLNGNFEDNIAGVCSLNLTNHDFDSIMSNCYGIGTGNEIDVQDSACGYSTPANGHWFISLATQPNIRYDVVSLKIKEFNEHCKF